jgi:hypothetical protein
MKGTLQELANNGDLVKHETITEEFWDPCKKMNAAMECVGGYFYKDKDWTWLPKTMSIDVSKSDGADVGSLEYEIDCSGGPQCDVCRGAKFGTGFLSFVAKLFSPVVGTAADVLLQGTSATCLAEGC